MSNEINNMKLESLEGRTLMSANLSATEVAINGGIQLRISGGSASDKITVAQTLAGLVVKNGTELLTFNKSYKSIMVHGNSGNDVITIDSSVKTNCILHGDAGNDAITAGAGADSLYGEAGDDVLKGGNGNDVLVSIGGGQKDQEIGGNGEDSFWADAESSEVVTNVSAVELAKGNVHRVGGFFSYKYSDNGAMKTATVSRDALGQNLVDPTMTSKSMAYKNFATSPLFSDAGPAENDIAQGYVGDCYFLATLSSVAKTNANLIRQSVVDLGDGTYAVQFVRNGQKVFVRVDADLPTWYGQNAYAGMGANGSLWVAIMEKAFAEFRATSANYAAIDGGWMSEVYSALGKSSSSLFSPANSSALMSWIKTQMDAGKSVTFAVATPASGAPLVGNHAYTVDAVIVDGGTMSLKLRNPWGVDGAGNDGANDGYVTITAAQAFGSFMGAMAAAV